MGTEEDEEEETRKNVAVGSDVRFVLWWCCGVLVGLGWIGGVFPFV